MWEQVGAVAQKILTNKWFWIILVVLIIVYAIYKYGKAHGDAPKDISYPSKGLGIPAGWNPAALVEEFHTDLNDYFTLPTTKSEVYKKIFDLPTDDMVVAVYNGFNQRYYTKDNGTMTQWVRDELTNHLDGNRNNLLDRFLRLDLP